MPKPSATKAKAAFARRVVSATPGAGRPGVTGLEVP